MKRHTESNLSRIFSQILHVSGNSRRDPIPEQLLKRDRNATMYLSWLAASLLPLLAACMPVEPRAGGPAAVPIPANCTVVNPFTQFDYTLATTNGLMPSAGLNSSHAIYSSFYDTPSDDQSVDAIRCMEECYGYGSRGTCKAAVLAFQAPTPVGYYDTPGGVLEVGCIMYDAYLSPSDFEAAPDGQYLNMTTGNIVCP